MTPLQIGIHADSGRGAGLGHLGRCTALAQAFRRLGARVVFFGGTPEVHAWTREHGFGLASGRAGGFDLIIADSYRLTKPAWAALKTRSRKLLAVDDFGTLPPTADFVLNGNVFAGGLEWRAKPGACLFLGPAFQPLRREYWETARPKAVRPRIRRVLVTFGGGAMAGAAIEAARAVARTLTDARITAVLGPLSAPLFSTASRNIEWLPRVACLKPLLEGADVVVSGGGQSIYEAAYCGTPVLGFVLAENQRPNLAAAATLGCALDLGAADSRGLARLAGALSRLDASPARRKRMAAAGQSLIDGRGADRVARVVAGLLTRAGRKS